MKLDPVTLEILNNKVVAIAVENVTGRQPRLTAGGGPSDARFIKDHCPVVEFGLTAAGAHKVDESVAVADIHALSDIYGAVLDDYFAPEG